MAYGFWSKLLFSLLSPYCSSYTPSWEQCWVLTKTFALARHSTKGFSFLRPWHGSLALISANFSCTENWLTMTSRPVTPISTSLVLLPLCSWCLYENHALSYTLNINIMSLKFAHNRWRLYLPVVWGTLCQVHTGFWRQHVKECTELVIFILRTWKKGYHFSAFWEILSLYWAR